MKRRRLIDVNYFCRLATTISAGCRGLVGEAMRRPRIAPGLPA